MLAPTTGPEEKWAAHPLDEVLGRRGAGAVCGDRRDVRDRGLEHNKMHEMVAAMEDPDEVLYFPQVHYMYMREHICNGIVWSALGWRPMVTTVPIFQNIFESTSNSSDHLR